jgi:predicted NUDIX family phosphoesterase
VSPLQPVSNGMGLTFSKLLTGYRGGGFVARLHSRSISGMGGHVEAFAGQSVRWLD